MNLSELKYAIREMIIDELSTVVDKNSVAADVKGKNPATVAAAIDRAKELGKPVAIAEDEEQLDEMASFYKIKDDVDKKKAIAAINKAIEANPRKKNLQTILQKLRDTGEANLPALDKEKEVSPGTYNSVANRQALDSIEFLVGVNAKKGRKADPNKPAKEPKEKGVPGRKKGSTKPKDALAFTMGGDVSISGKDATKSFIKRAIKAADLGKPVELLKMKDMAVIDKEIVDLGDEMKSKVARAKEIAAKGNQKSYTEEEEAFMSDLRAKRDRLLQLKATKEKLLKNTIKKQDRNIDVTNADLD